MSVSARGAHSYTNAEHIPPWQLSPHIIRGTNESLFIQRAAKDHELTQTYRPGLLAHPALHLIDFPVRMYRHKRSIGIHKTIPYSSRIDTALHW